MSRDTEIAEKMEPLRPHDVIEAERHLLSLGLVWSPPLSTSQ